jgi:hypothetical protein
MDVITSELTSISPTHYGVAQFAYSLMKDQYKCTLVKKSYVWFQKQSDGSWKKIPDILVRNRLSTDVVDGIALCRQNFKKSPDYTRIESITSRSKSLENLHVVLRSLIDEKRTLQEAGNNDDIKEVNVKIRDTESSIDRITKVMDFQRAEVRDRVFSEYAEAEGKLYNSTFKNGVMKELAGFFYVDE